MREFRIAEWFYLHFYCPNSTVTYDKHISQINFDFLSNEQKKFLPKKFAFYQKLETLTDEQSLFLGIFTLLEMLRVAKLNPYLWSYKILANFRLKDWLMNTKSIKTINLYRQFPNTWVSDRVSECDIKMRILDILPKVFYKNPSNSLEGFVKVQSVQIPLELKAYFAQEQIPIKAIQCFKTLFFTDVQTQEEQTMAHKILEGKIPLEESNFWAEANLDFWIDMERISI